MDGVADDTHQEDEMSQPTDQEHIDQRRVEQMQHLLAERNERAVEQRYGRSALGSAEYQEAQRRSQLRRRRGEEVWRQARAEQLREQEEHERQQAIAQQQEQERQQQQEEVERQQQEVEQQRQREQQQDAEQNLADEVSRPETIADGGRDERGDGPERDSIRSRQGDREPGSERDRADREAVESREAARQEAARSFSQRARTAQERSRERSGLGR